MPAKYLRYSSSVERANSTAYSLGQRLSLSYLDAQSSWAIKRQYVYEVTTAGTSGAAVPNYPTVPGTTVADGTLVLTCRECTSWGNAAKYMQYVAPACDDFLYVASTHDESLPVTTISQFPATLLNPIRVLSVLDSVEPPTTLAAGAKVSTTLASRIDLYGSVVFYGIEFTCGTGSNPVSIRMGQGANIQWYQNCIFNVVASSSGAGISVGDGGSTSTTASEITWENCYVKNGNVGQSAMGVQHANFRWTGGGLIGPIAINTRFISSSSNRAGKILAENLDLSAMGTFCAVASTSAIGDIVVRNCKLPAGWVGSAHILSPVIQPAVTVTMDNCDDGDTNYRSIRASYAGVSSTETAYVRTGGASNGVTPFSVKLATSSTASAVASPLYSTQVFRWNDTVGTPTTVVVEILHDSATDLTNADIFLEVSYPSVTDNPLGATASNRVSNFLLGAVPTAHDASAETWVTTGMTNPRKQKLSVTFTPQEKGFFIAKVGVCVPDYILYLDPKMQVI